MAISRDETIALFDQMRSQFNPDKAEGIDAVIQFQFNDAEDIKYWLHVRGEQLQTGEGQSENPRITLIADSQDFADVVHGELNAMQAFMSGKLKVKGDMPFALKLQSIFEL